MKAGGGLENSSLVRGRDAVWGVGTGGLELTPPSCDPELSKPGSRYPDQVPYTGGRSSPLEPASKQSPLSIYPKKQLRGKVGIPTLTLCERQTHKVDIRGNLGRF